MVSAPQNPTPAHAPPQKKYPDIKKKCTFFAKINVYL